MLSYNSFEKMLAQFLGEQHGLFLRFHSFYQESKRISAGNAQDFSNDTAYLSMTKSKFSLFFMLYASPTYP